MRPGKAAASKAAKILRNPKSTKTAKSSAAKILAKRASSGRIIKSAPRSGTVKQSVIKRAVSTVRSKKRRGSKRR